MSHPDPEVVRRAVERTYASVSPPATGKRLAGYTDAQLAAVPEGVAFYGCGNPLAYTEVRPGQTVLDLGSGAGLDLILAGQAVGPSGRVIGVDMIDTMLERARANVARAGLGNVEVRKGLIEALPVEDASVDWVISNCVISLSPEKERVFAEVARVLRPGGQMLVSDIVVDERLAWLLRRLVRIAPSVAMARTEAEYLGAMRGAGLAEVGVIDRFVYGPDELIGLFGEGAGAVPRWVVALVARAVAGHLWSSKFHARRS